MNKKLVPVVVILLLLAGGVYYLKTKQSPSGVVDNQTAGQATNEAAEFARAMESGKPTVCTMAKGDDKMEYHIKDKKMLANITSTVNGKLNTSHMINDEKYLYVWDDTQKQGSKMAIPTEEETKKANESLKQFESEQAAPKFDSESDYANFKNEGYVIDCKAGNVTDATFLPPSDVKFIDPSEMMKAIPSPDADGKFDMSQLEELQKQYGDTQ